MTVPERLRAAQKELTPAERRVVRVLLSGFPLAGLDPVAVLAERAGTSAPTVLRLVTKIGFDGYPAFQRALKDELADRLSSPLEMYPAEPAGPAVLARMADSLTEAVRAGFAALPPAEVDAAVRLLADSRRRAWVLGGRFSGMLADYLVAHLQQLRPKVTGLPAAQAGRASALLDVDRRSVVVAFDYRRYQTDTIDFGAAAKAQGATVVLFTDHYLSPLAASADVVLSTPVRTPSPFDVLTPAVALVEALVAAVLDRLGEAPRRRMARFDALSAGMVVSNPGEEEDP